MYRATDVRHNRKVAVKVLHPDLASSVGSERFTAEVLLTASLQHPIRPPSESCARSYGRTAATESASRFLRAGGWTEARADYRGWRCTAARRFSGTPYSSVRSTRTAPLAVTATT